MRNVGVEAMWTWSAKVLRVWMHVCVLRAGVWCVCAGVCVCMCRCVCLCRCVCVVCMCRCVCVCLCRCACVCVCVQVCVCAGVRVCRCACVCVCVRVSDSLSGSTGRCWRCWVFLCWDPLHLQRESADGRLEIRLFCVHHQPHAALHSVLNKHTWAYIMPFICNNALQ